MIIKISKAKYNTLMYWANVGLSSKRGQEYRKKYPNRRSPYDKIDEIRTQVLSGNRLTGKDTNLFKHLVFK